MRNVIFVLVLLITGCANQVSQTEQQLVSQLTVSKNYSGLIELYKSKVVDNDKDWLSQQLLAEAYLANEDVESADFYIQRVLTLSPKPTADAHLIKGKILAKNFNYKEAIEQYSHAMVLGLNSADLYMSRGIALAQAKHYETAIDSFNLARLRGFDEVSVKNNIAMVHIYQGDFQSAVDILLPIYEQDSSNSKVNANLKLSVMKLEGEESLEVQDESGAEVLVLNDPAKESVGSELTVNKETQLVPDILDTQVEVTPISAEAFFKADAPLNAQKNEPQPRSYHLQLGAYDNMPEALEKRNALLTAQLPITIRPADLGSSGTWYRLLTGDFTSYRQAQLFAKKNKQLLAEHEYFIQVIK
ncbi:SPOR domain-containing protein [Vibrio rarus]|uniref:SPOR domain-containing protein n=1 Tax=Vibrio rarus TaxID=413403 RepID=UPI0021C26BDB|nr:SPOR domain-containing protein [Vibrio rarus]